MSSFPPPPPPPPPNDPDDPAVRRPPPPPLQVPQVPHVPDRPPSFEPVPTYLQPTTISPPPSSFETTTFMPVGQVVEPPPEQGRRSGLMVAAIIGGAAVVGGLVGLVLSGGDDAPKSVTSVETSPADSTPDSEPAVVLTTVPDTTVPETSEVPTTVIDTTVPPETAPPTTVLDLTAIPPIDSGSFAGPGIAMIVAAQLPSGPTALDVTPSALSLQRVADLLAAGDYAGVQSVLPQEVVDPVAFDAVYGPIERLSMIVLDARADPGGAGFEMLAAGVSNEVGGQTTIRCFRWFSNGSVVDRVGDIGVIISGPFPEQFTAEQVRNDPQFIADITASCPFL